ncbi:hypothetical protein CRG98_022605 [Punica granatum]|uniref:G-patch domain-containing protein n=2 Tax=Punica granatum TaxID=22663 RepID=A0A2I0JL47_PUNGR|nr:hypothetical protein CRG98_022605 [Punica granatum]
MCGGGKALGLEPPAKKGGVMAWTVKPRSWDRAVAAGDSAPRESVLPCLDIQSGVDRPRSPIAPSCIVVFVSVSFLFCAGSLDRRPRPKTISRRPISGCRLLVRGSSPSRAPSRKASVRVRGCPGLSRRLLKCARRRHGSFWYQEGFLESHIGYLLMLRRSVTPSFGRKSSTGAGGPKWGADNGSSPGPSVNMISIAAIEEEEEEAAHKTSIPFVNNYGPVEVAVTSVPFIVEVPAKESYQDSRVPWRYEGEVTNAELEMSAMGIMRSGRVYQGSESTNKGKALAAAFSAIPETSSFPSKKVTDQEAEAFMKWIKASEYKVVEQMILEIPNAFSLLLGRPWIHAAGAVPSSLHQKLKFFVESKLITVNSKEDYAVYKETVVPYISIGEDQNLPFHSFDTISVIRDYGEVGPSQADRMIGKVLLKNDYVLGTGLGACAQGILRPIEVEEYRNRRGLGFRPFCHEIVQAHCRKHLHRLAAHYRNLSRGIPVPPLSQFFPAPPQIMGGTSDSPITESNDFSSDAVDAFLALPAIYAVTKETSFGVYIRLAREDEELTNSAMVADV